MLDGIQEDSHYPADFCVDLMFAETKEPSEKPGKHEDRNQIWRQIAQTCAEKLSRQSGPGEELKSTPQPVPAVTVSAEKAEEEEKNKQAFVIASPSMGSSSPADKVTEALKKSPYTLDSGDNTPKDKAEKKEGKMQATSPAPAAKADEVSQAKKEPESEPEAKVPEKAPEVKKEPAAQTPVAPVPVRAESKEEDKKEAAAADKVEPVPALAPVSVPASAEKKEDKTEEKREEGKKEEKKKEKPVEKPEEKPEKKAEKKTEEKKEEKSEEKKTEEKKEAASVTDDKDLDAYLSSVTDLIKEGH